MKIAHVCPYDYSVSGGVGEHVMNLHKQHSSMGHDVRVIAPSSKQQDLGPHVITVPSVVAPVPGAGSIARIAVSPPVWGRVRRILHDGEFDVVHVHEPLLPMVGFAATFHARSISVGTIHGYRDRYPIYQYLNWPLRRMMDRLTARTAVSVDAERWASQYFPGKYHIISDGVDVDRFSDETIKPIEELDDGALNVLFLGRLEKRKGLQHLLDAFPRVKAQVPEARLIVAGDYDASQKQRWSDHAKERGATDVLFVGKVAADDLPRYYRTAHVFCAPSTGFEALGIVLLEAMASGTPVVTTDIPGYRTVVTHGREATVVQPERSDQLAEALVQLLRDPDLRSEMGERGQERAQDYAWPTIARRLVELYRSCGAH